jgi:hypothetical protein
MKGEDKLKDVKNIVPDVQGQYFLETKSLPIVELLKNQN